jgi:hypothetical protein
VNDIIDIDRGWERIKKELELADESFVTFGLHEDAGLADGALTVAQVGAYHEFGTPKVPQRAWHRPTVDEKRPELERAMDEIYYRGIMEGKISTKRGLAVVGQMGQQALQDTLRNKRSEWPPLAESTKRRKARTIKGSKREKKTAGQRKAEFISGSGNPLIDTGQLIQSIRYKVVLRYGGVSA